jgi:hypothetical protein
MKDLLIKHAFKIYFIAGILIAYSQYLPIFYERAGEWVVDEGLLYTILIGIGFIIALPVVFAYGLWVLSLLLIPLFAMISINTQDRDVESVMALLWVAVGTLSVIFSMFELG